MAWHIPIARAAVPALSLALFAAIAPARAATVPESPDPIVIGKLDWTGQEITAEITGEILRRMGYKVQFVQTTQVPLFQAVSDGQITAYLENGGLLEHAQAMAAHASARTTKLYDRRGETIALDEVERITL